MLKKLLALCFVASVLVNLGLGVHYLDSKGVIDFNLSSANLGSGNFSVSGFVFVDSNQNGVKDNDEQGLSARTVALTNREGNTILATNITSDTGSFVFNNLSPGEYRLTHPVPNGFVRTTDDSRPFVITDSNEIWSFGVVQTNLLPPANYSVSGIVFVDANKNGRRDLNEEALSARPVILTYGDVKQTVQTDNFGNYNFSGLAAGNYRVTHIVPSGFERTTDDSRPLEIKNANEVWNFGVAKLKVTPPPPLNIITYTVPSGQINAYYNTWIKATGGPSAYSWYISRGSLPPGLSSQPVCPSGLGWNDYLCQSEFVINGVPTLAGTYEFTVTVFSGAVSASHTYSLYVEKAPAKPLDIATTTVPDGQVGVPYATWIKAVGGESAYSWSMVAGTLPPGLSSQPVCPSGLGWDDYLCQSEFVINGTPTTWGSYEITVAVRSGQEVAYQNLQFKISQIPPTVLMGKIAYIYVTKPGTPVNSGKFNTITDKKNAFPALFTEATRGLGSVETAGLFILEAHPSFIKLDPNGVGQFPNVPELMKNFYKTYPDSYDFAHIHFDFPITNACSSVVVGACHYQPINNIQGIGLGLSDESHLYGSNGTLKGVSIFEQAPPAVELHEFGHQWCCYVGDLMQGLGTGRLEIRDGLSHFYLGLNFPNPPDPMGGYVWHKQSDGTYKIAEGLLSKNYSDFSLYLMGLLTDPAAFSKQYELLKIVPGSEKTLATFYRNVSVNDIIAVAGPRKTVVLAKPEITKITPASGQRGQVVDLAIEGRNFSGAAIYTGKGVSPYIDRGFQLESATLLSDNQINARYRITSDAEIGPRHITITTPTGMSNSKVFNIVSNVALGKTATQSSNYFITGEGVAAKAVDGNTNGSWYNQSVTHTNLDNQAWWEVDLGSSYQIDNVKVWNRTDCCADRLTNFSVYVSDNPLGLPFGPGVFIYSTPSQAGIPTIIPVNRTGRYVRVQLTGSNYLSLAEVEVFASAGSGSGGGGGGQPAGDVTTGASITGSFTYPGLGAGGNAALIDDTNTPAADPAGLNSSTNFRLDFGATNRHIRRLTVTKDPTYGVTNPATMKLEYSDDATSYTPVGTPFTITAGTDTTPQIFDFPTSGPHRYWRVSYVSGTIGGNSWLREIEMME